MLSLGLELRRTMLGAPDTEFAAQRLVRHLYESCRDPSTRQRSCVLVRFYKTLRYAELEPGLQSIAGRLLDPSGNSAPDPELRCLTLLATAGERPEWNDRRQSVSHQTIPLPSARIVEQAPMIAQLIEQMGLTIADVIRPSPEVIRGAKGRTYNVFHVEEARGSPSIPAQDEFVVPFGVRSAVGFGGLLRDEFFATILFSRVTIPRASAERFRKVALEVKSALFALNDESGVG